MGNIKDIVDLAMQLESRAKDRKDIDTLRSIISLTQTIQSDNAEVVERDIRVMQENAQLMRDKAELERQLAAAKAEDIRIHRGIEFRRGERTRLVWMPFCPKCKMPAKDIGVVGYDGAPHTITCSAGCGWQVEDERGLSGIMVEVMQW